MNSWYRELERVAAGRVVSGEPLARMSTFRIGGPAAALVEPESVEDLSRVLRLAHDNGITVFALGLGSNILCPDQGLECLVVRFSKRFSGVEEKKTRWRVQAGLPTPLLARKTAAAGLSGVHRLVGVPGTVGGGIYMNAGAHGQEFREVTRRVTAVARDGEVRTLDGSAIPWEYRSSGLGDLVVAEAELELRHEEARVLESDIRRHFRWRREGTPFDQPCCGSVFKNPAEEIDGQKMTAGQLIDSLGLKGTRVGGAEVSTMHANYIINRDDASASDVLGLIDLIREQVRRQKGIELALEVRVIGPGCELQNP